jgi:hypothetical protein
MIIFKLALAVVAATGWQSLPPAPITPEFNARTSVWTGKEMLVFGRDQQTALDSRGKPYATGALNVAAAYEPQARRWRKLAPPAKTSGFLGLASVWTGKEMLVWGQGTQLAYNPSTDAWRRLPASRLLRVHDGFGAVVWTGKEMLGWGGGCCGDSFSDGVAYNPATNRWRALPKAPLPGDQHPLGVWTGKEYIVIAGGKAAAYHPGRNEWRRVAAPLPHSANATAVWYGDLVVVAGGSRTAVAYQPSRNRWRRLPWLPVGRVGNVVVTDGASVYVWGGVRGGASLSYDAKAWTPFAHGPLPSRLEATVVSTGNGLIVWGGLPTKTWGHYDQAGGLYTPPAVGCGDDWMGENLAVTPRVKSALRAAYVSAHRGVHVGAPLAGHTYYGMYSGTSYAIATFSASPTVFRTDALGRWRVRADTDGRICSNVLPVELARVWSLRHDRGSCYVLPR